MIRRTPRREIPFSTLMFLSPSPPRLTRRSRLDQILLLLLRAAALTLLAIAFARPFLRQAAQQVIGPSAQERVLVLMDASASMRRENLWRQAQDLAVETIEACRPLDEIAVYAFDQQARPVVSFADTSQIEPSQRAAVMRRRLADAAPTWSGTHLGAALQEALELSATAGDETVPVNRVARRIVLISDMQSGSRLDVLGESNWPEDVRLELRAVKPRQLDNAGMQLLASGADEATADEQGRDLLRVRVVNSSDSTAEEFRLRWFDEWQSPVGDRVDVTAPPGKSRVARISPPSEQPAAARLRLEGDAHSFDNDLYVAIPPNETLEVVHLGIDRLDDPQGHGYYLQRALQSDATRQIRIAQIEAKIDEKPAQSSDEPLSEAWELDVDDPPSLVVATHRPTSGQLETLDAYLKNGGVVLYVVAPGDRGEALERLVGADQPLQIEEGDVDGYAMLREIDFGHSLFAPMAGPQFNNFTQIRIWRFRRIDESSLQPCRIVARFESGDPAIIEKRVAA
ncbi:MAG: VWA domain-containing protein, partial [Planctomycetota bacterium]